MLYGRHMMIELSQYFFTASLILFWHQLPTIESSVNLALKKNTSQSSDFGGYPSSNAVDGQNKYCANKGFAHTNDSESEWWRVDLGEVCEIKTIQIFYRTNFLNRLDGYSINIKKSLNPVDTWQCYKDDIVGAPINSTQYHICRRLGRYVVFSREKKIIDYRRDRAVINLCELEVYGCPQSRYGDNCTLNCSIGCLYSRCDPDNGHCNCSSNKWKGDRCNEIMCGNDYYIDGGNYISCPSGCLGGKCNQENGECHHGCKSQFYGKICNLTCPPNCNNTYCSRDNGSCIGCKSVLMVKIAI
ncbi:hypothetical protein KUTeg_011544 [Tegillarca granosa]|uniref:Fucolectin tachylectin-4 pentraxin-1 domain-containing protein n=1 Tax=Tegillarca granosa TaxID=220873 RepID=A0ABQ9EWW7_TEGGR|nr:hypothetical protein KUTeg_011544 [Tegillarca granosa]